MSNSFKKVIIKILCLLTISFGLFIQIFSQSDVFSVIGQLINFSTYTLTITINMLFYIFLLSVLIIFFRKEITNSHKEVNKIQKLLDIIAGIFFISSVALIYTIVPIVKTIQPVKYNSLYSIIITIFVLIILGPITEELFFRKLLISHFLEEYNYSKIKTVILCSLLFYLPHFLNANTGLIILFLGFFCSILFIYTNSIKIPILLHSTSNLLGMLLFNGYFIKSRIEYVNITVIASYIIMGLAFTLLIVSRRLIKPV